MKNPFKRNELEYCNIIAEIGKENKNSLVWWACNASSKNLGDSSLWDNFQRWPEDSKKAKKNLSFGDLFKYAAYIFFSWIFAVPFKIRMKYFFSKPFGERILFFSHLNDSSWISEKYQDIYFQPLMSFLNRKDKNFDIIAFSHGNLGAIRKFCPEKIISENKIYPLEIFISPLIIIKALLIVLFCKPNLKGTHLFRGKNVIPLVREQYETDRRNGRIFHNLCVYFSLIKAFKKLKPKKIIWPWENHCWEKMMLLAKRKVLPDAFTVGYQHSTISMYLLNHFPGEDEHKCAPFPDRILTAGEEPYKILSSFGDFPDGVLQESCALRYENLYDCSPVSEPLDANSCIGIVLTTYTESDEKVIKCAMEAFGKNRDVKVILKLHPMKNKTSYRLRIKEMLPDNFDIFEGTIKDFIDKICILLYSETTVCFEVAAKGVPCIYIDTGKGLLGDTMFNSDALKWSAKSPEELKEVFQRIIFKDIGELNKNRVAAGKYVKTYFHPVSENELEKFIER